MRDKDKRIIQRMLQRIDYASEHKNSMDYAEFSENVTVSSACAFEVLQIGELATELNEEILNQVSDIPWKKMRSMRNRLVHDYENVDLRILWDTLNNDLPDLKRKLEVILEKSQ